MTKYLLPDFLVYFFKLSKESTTILSPPACADRSLDCQIGNGVPQYLSREIAQSLMPSNHSPKRPSRIWAGSQLIVLFSLTITSRSLDIAMYHESRA